MHGVVHSLAAQKKIQYYVGKGMKFTSRAARWPTWRGRRLRGESRDE